MRSASFIQGSVGQIFCVQWQPSISISGRAPFLIVPPFAEEMNKSRHVMAALGQALATCGHSAVCFDFYGTGDSEGEFAEANLAHWRRDIDCVVEAFAQSDLLNLVGLRAGALLAAEAAGRHNCGRLVLLQPLAEGRQLLNQIFRLRLASGISGGKQETTVELKHRMEEDGFLEVAGYAMSAQLAQDLDSFSRKQHPDRCGACSVAGIGGTSRQTANAAKYPLDRSVD